MAKEPALGTQKKRIPASEGTNRSGIEPTKGPEGKRLTENVNLLVDKIVELHRQQLVDFAYRLGELVVNELFDGDARLLHQPGPKAKTLSRLANHPRLPVSPPTLSRSVGVYEMLERLPQFRNNTSVTIGHLYAVLGLQQEKQLQLLTSSIEKSWAVERLQKEVAKARDKELRGKRGRPPLLPGVKALGAVERMFKGETPLHDLSFVEGLDKEQIEHMKKVVDEMQAWCIQAEKLIERRLKVVDVDAEEEGST